nr:PB1 domain-containing protein [Tanacetum cinerariifolium]
MWVVQEIDKRLRKRQKEKKLKWWKIDRKTRLEAASRTDNKNMPETVTIKYFMPGNKRNLITVKNDKDVKKNDFHGDALTAQVCFWPPGFVRVFLEHQVLFVLSWNVSLNRKLTVAQSSYL